MSCNCSSSNPLISIGSEPVNIKWTVVRGDDVSTTFEFYEDDGVTPKDTTGWTYLASAYNPKTSTKYTLTVASGAGYVDISANSTMTSGWGVGSSHIVAELIFDLQVTVIGEKWTPILGTIVVYGDITGSAL